MAFGVWSAVSEAVVPSLVNVGTVLSGYLPQFGLVGQSVMAATAYVALGWLVESPARAVPLSTAALLLFTRPVTGESVKVLEAREEALLSPTDPEMDSVSVATLDPMAVSGFSTVAHATGASGEIFGSASESLSAVISPPGAAGTPAGSMLGQLYFSQWIPELFLYPLIASICSPSEEYQHQGTAVGVTALFELLSPEEINAFYQEAIAFARPLQPTYEQMKKLNLSIRDFEQQLQKNSNNGALRRKHTQLLADLAKAEQNLRVLIHRGYPFSAKMQVLVSFIFERQGAVASRRPYDCLLSDQKKDTISLQLQSGERIKATSLKGLFNQLWSRSTLQREHFGLQTVKAYAKELPKLLQNGELYSLEAINHCLLIQRQGDQFILFDPHQGIFKSKNIEVVLGNIDYLRKTGSIKDPLLTLSLAAAPLTRSQLPAHFKVPRMLTKPALMSWVVRAIAHNDKVLLHHVLSADSHLHSPSLLTLAALHNHFEIAEMLRAKYALAVNSDMLITAIEHNHVGFVRSVMESAYFQDIDWNVGQSNPDSVGAYLLLALEKQHMGIVELLIANFSVKVKALIGEESPLKMAVQQGNLRALELLLMRPDLGVTEVPVTVGQYSLMVPVLQFAEEIKASPRILECLYEKLARPQNALLFGAAAPIVGQGDFQHLEVT